MTIPEDTVSNPFPLNRHLCPEDFNRGHSPDPARCEETRDEQRREALAGGTTCLPDFDPSDECCASGS